MSDKVQDLINVILSVSQKGNTHLELHLSNDVDSYFSDPVRPEYSKLDQVPFEDKQLLIQYLQAFWNDSEELLQFIPGLADLAFQLKSLEANQESDLSPYIYTLF
jgi:hypothetical protein